MGRVLIKAAGAAPELRLCWVAAAKAVPLGDVDRVLVLRWLLIAGCFDLLAADVLESFGITAVLRHIGDIKPRRISIFGGIV